MHRITFHDVSYNRHRGRKTIRQVSRPGRPPGSRNIESYSNERILSAVDVFFFLPINEMATLEKLFSQQRQRSWPLARFPPVVFGERIFPLSSFSHLIFRSARWKNVRESSEPGGPGSRRFANLVPLVRTKNRREKCAGSMVKSRDFRGRGGSCEKSNRSGSTVTGIRPKSSGAKLKSEIEETFFLSASTRSLAPTAQRSPRRRHSSSAFEAFSVSDWSAHLIGFRRMKLGEKSIGKLFYWPALRDSALGAHIVSP